MRSNDSLVKRRSMAKAITLLESTRADHRAQADALMMALQGELAQGVGSSNASCVLNGPVDQVHQAPLDTLRLGVSGSPGVGKSTFIEALGLALVERGHRVAVLAVDPSSSLTGGSIMGDKTRMEHLSLHPQAFVRPSPSAGNLGGVCEKTRECMMVCEYTGYDVILVETVGVGQSEIAVANMTDVFLLLQLPNAGDDLQAMKKGVMEFADFVAINKCDLDVEAATRAEASMLSALRLLQSATGVHSWQPHPYALVSGGLGESLGPEFRKESGQEPDKEPNKEPNKDLDPKVWVDLPHPEPILPYPVESRVHQVSALKGLGVQALVGEILAHRQWMKDHGLWAKKRQAQSKEWLWERIDSGLKQGFTHSQAVQKRLPQVLREVAQGFLTPSLGARELLNLFYTHALTGGDPATTRE
jgi:LAO/AO transport system kinase